MVNHFCYVSLCQNVKTQEIRQAETLIKLGKEIILQKSPFFSSDFHCCDKTLLWKTTWGGNGSISTYPFRSQSVFEGIQSRNSRQVPGGGNWSRSHKWRYKIKFSIKNNTQYWHKTRHLNQWNRLENTTMSVCNCKHMILTKMPKTHWKTFSKYLINGWKTMCNLMFPETARIKHRQHLTRCRFGKALSEYNSIYPRIKANNRQVESCKHECFYTAKINSVKRKSTQWERIFAGGLTFIMYKEFFQGDGGACL